MAGLRNLVRVLVGAALGVALAACVVLPVPENLPAIALEQAALYRLEVALSIFYGCLLLATPAYSGLVRGRLPTEISTRGAKFAGEAEQSAGLNEKLIWELEQRVDSVVDGLSETMIEIARLKGEVTGDDHR